jgi:site-specific DNA recombinase
MEGKTMTKRAVLYARVSTEEQGKNYSLPTQLEACRRYAASNGLTVVSEFTDTHTGTELERPGLTTLLDFVREQGADAVIVYDLDRLSRDTVDLGIIEREIEFCKARVEYVIGGYDGTPEGELLKLVKAGVARYENRQRVERSRRGKMGRVKAGHVLLPKNRAPYGYTYVSDGKGRGHLEIGGEEAGVVRQMYRWLLEEGVSSYEIARRLFGKVLTKGDTNPVVGAVKTRSRSMEWDPVTVRRILTNPVYKGEWFWGKTRRRKVNGKTVQQRVPKDEWIMVRVPALVSTETWDQAQAQLRINKQMARRNTKRQYLLRSLVFCPCGRRWVGRYKNHLKRAYYRCPTTESEPWRNACTNRFSIRQENLEDTVWRAVRDFVLEPDNLRAQIERQRRDCKLEADKKLERLRTIERFIADTDKKLGMLLDQVLTGDFPQAIVEDHKQRLLAQREDSESERRRIQLEIEATTITEDQEQAVLALGRQVRCALDDVPFDDKRRMLELLRIRVDVIDRRTIKISGVISDGSIVETLSSSAP